jgi:hypothetical protein
LARPRVVWSRARTVWPEWLQALFVSLTDAKIRYCAISKTLNLKPC